jgi:hypothetical protein
MTIKLLSKNSMGIILTLLLVILLSESRLFKFLTDTYLGRIFLITILLVASYLNKILGIVCVFIIIIMFNINVLKYEGFDTNTEKSSDSDKKDETTTTNKITTPITTHTPTPKDAKKEPNDKINVVTTSSSSENIENSENSENSESIKNTKSAIEGFDLQSTENNIKRGKQSNSIPVNQYYKQSIEVAPYEEPSFSNFFGLL